MMKRLRWVVLALIAVVAVALVTAATTRYDGETRTYRATLQSRQILTACEAYRENPDNPQRKFPSALPELVNPPFGGPSFLKNGAEDLRDPWGNFYRYAVVTRDNGEQEVYVWGERTVDGKLKLIGAKLRANGDTELFGSE
jgi:hypothetical protein